MDCDSCLVSWVVSLYVTLSYNNTVSQPVQYLDLHCTAVIVDACTFVNLVSDAQG